MTSSNFRNLRTTKFIAIRILRESSTHDRQTASHGMKGALQPHRQSTRKSRPVVFHLDWLSGRETTINSRQHMVATSSAGDCANSPLTSQESNFSTLRTLNHGPQRGTMSLIRNSHMQDQDITLVITAGTCDLHLQDCKHPSSYVHRSSLCSPRKKRFSKSWWKTWIWKVSWLQILLRYSLYRRAPWIFSCTLDNSDGCRRTVHLIDVIILFAITPSN